MKAPGVGDGPPVNIGEIKPSVPSVPAPAPIEQPPAVTTPVAEKPLPKILTEDDALKLAKAKVQINHPNDNIDDEKLAPEIQAKLEEILEKATTPELEKEKPQGAQEVVSPESVERTEAEDFSDIEEAWGNNRDPIEGSAAYQVISANDENFWSTSQSDVDAYLTAHGVTNITSDIRNAEIRRREEIQKAVKPLKQIATAEKTAEDKIEEFIKGKVTETEPAKIEKQKKLIRTTYASDIQNIQNGVYTVDTDGTYHIVGIDHPISIKDYTKTIVEQALKDLTEDGSNPKRQAKTKKNYDILKDRIRDDGSFEPKKPKTETEKAKEINEPMVRLAHDLEEDLIETYGVDVFKRDSATQEPIDIDEEALGKLPQNEPLARLAVNIVNYRRASKNSDPRVNNNIALAMYHEMRSLPADQIPKISNPELREKIRILKENGDAVFTTRSTTTGNEWAKGYFRPVMNPAEAEIPIGNEVRDGILALHLKDKLIPVFNEAHQIVSYDLPPEIEAILNTWKVQSLERKGIIEWARAGNEAGRFLTNELGFSTAELESKNFAETYAEETMVALEATAAERGKKYTPAKREAYKKVVKHNLSDQSLRELAKKLGFPPQMGMGVLILALFLPMIQGVMDTGGGAGEERGGGG